MEEVNEEFEKVKAVMIKCQYKYEAAIQSQINENTQKNRAARSEKDNKEDRTGAITEVKSATETMHKSSNRVPQTDIVMTIRTRKKHGMDKLFPFLLQSHLDSYKKGKSVNQTQIAEEFLLKLMSSKHLNVLLGTKTINDIHELPLNKLPSLLVQVLTLFKQTYLIRTWDFGMKMYTRFRMGGHFKAISMRGNDSKEPITISNIICKDEASLSHNQHHELFYSKMEPESGICKLLNLYNFPRDNQKFSLFAMESTKYSEDQTINIGAYWRKSSHSDKNRGRGPYELFYVIRDNEKNFTTEINKIYVESIMFNPKTGRNQLAPHADTCILAYMAGSLTIRLHGYHKELFKTLNEKLTKMENTFDLNLKYLNTDFKIDSVIVDFRVHSE